MSEHLPERLGLPGFVAARRYEAETGSPRFFTSYDVESVEVLSSADYLARLAAPSPLTREVMANFRNMTRTVCIPVYRSRGLALGGSVVAAYVEQPARVDDRTWIEAAVRLRARAEGSRSAGMAGYARSGARRHQRIEAATRWRQEDRGGGGRRSHARTRWVGAGRTNLRSVTRRRDAGTHLRERSGSVQCISPPGALVCAGDSPRIASA